MLEMRSAVAHDDRAGHAELFELLSLKGHNIDRVRVRLKMQSEIDQSRGGIFDRRETLIELARRKQPLQQSLRHWLTCLMVESEAA